MKCPKCGHENKDDAVACIMCYAMLKTPTGEVPPPPPPSPEPSVITPKEPKVVEGAKKVTTPQEKGFISTWWTTLWQVIKSPGKFFDTMPTSGGFGKPYLFALINMLVTGLGMFLLVFVMGAGKEKLPVPSISGIFLLLFLVIFLLIFALSSLVVFVQAGILNICAKLLMGRGNYEGTFRVAAYGSAVNVFSWIPIINFLTALYGIYIFIVGLKKVHGFSTGKAILAILLPGLLIGSIAIIFAVLGTLLGGC